MLEKALPAIQRLGNKLAEEDRTDDIHDEEGHRTGRVVRHWNLHHSLVDTSFVRRFTRLLRGEPFEITGLYVVDLPTMALRARRKWEESGAALLCVECLGRGNSSLVVVSLVSYVCILIRLDASILCTLVLSA